MTFNQEWPVAVAPPLKPPLSLTATGTNLPTGIVGAAYTSQAITTYVTANGGNGAYSYNVTDLPAGLSFNTTSNVITGTPSATFNGNVTVTLADSAGDLPATCTLLLAVKPQPSITDVAFNPTSSISGTTQSVAVSVYTGNADDGTAVTANLLDAGNNVQATASGQITSNVASLTLTVPASLPAGSYSVQATVAGASNSPYDAGAYAIKALPLIITSGYLPICIHGKPYSITLEANGGRAPYIWSATGLPSYLSLSANSGVIYGTPSVSVDSALTIAITVYDDEGNSKSKSFNLYTYTANPGGFAWDSINPQNPQKTDQTLDPSLVASLDTPDNGAVPDISVTGALGDFNRDAVVKDVSKDPLLKVIDGWVGHPVDIESSTTFDSATLSFKIKDSILATTNINNLVIVNYDTNTNALLPLPTSVDAVNKTISVTVYHFSIYGVMDLNKLKYNWDVNNPSSIIKNGQADVVFVLDSTGSMSSKIANVKNNINNFVNELAAKKVDVRLGLVEFKDITYDGPASTKNWGWYTGPQAFINKLSTIAATGGGDLPETPIDGLEQARNMGFRSNVTKFIILVTDANYKEGYTDPNFPNVTHMSQEVNLLKTDNIITSVIVDPAYQSLYTDLYTETGGLYASIYNNFATTLSSLTNLIGTTTSGVWVRLANGTVVKLLKQPDKSDTVTDSDGDVVPDSQELMNLIYITVPGVPEPVEAWTFKTNPAIYDTYGIGYSDSMIDVTLLPFWLNGFARDPVVTPKSGSAGQTFHFSALVPVNGAYPTFPSIVPNTSPLQVFIDFKGLDGQWMSLYDIENQPDQFEMDPELLTIPDPNNSGYVNVVFSKDYAILSPGNNEDDNVRTFKIVGVIPSSASVTGFYHVIFSNEISVIVQRKQYDNSLGILSAMHESLNDPGSISYIGGDTGGKSYGTYQFASNYKIPYFFIRDCLKGNPDDVDDFYDKLLNAYNEDGGHFYANFDNTWKACDAIDSDLFRHLQYEYMVSEYYQKTVDNVKYNNGLDINSRSLALKNVIFSRACHHGLGINPWNIESVLKAAFAVIGNADAIKAAPDDKLINAIYTESGKVILYKPGYNTMPDDRTSDLDQYLQDNGLNGKQVMLKHFGSQSGGAQLGIFHRLNTYERNEALNWYYNGVVPSA